MSVHERLGERQRLEDELLVDQVLERELQDEIDEAERLLTSDEADAEMSDVQLAGADPEVIVLDGPVQGEIVDLAGAARRAGPAAVAGPSRAVVNHRAQVPVCIDLGSSDDDDIEPPELSVYSGSSPF